MEWLIRKIAPLRKVTIITFHAVGENKITDNLSEEYNLYIDKKRFAKKIRFFKRYNIISFYDLVNSLERKEIPPNSIILTFDDGYDHDDAYGILKKYSVPATIFLTTDYINSNRRLPLNDMYFSIMKTKEKCIKLTLPPHGEIVEFDLTTLKNKQKVIMTLNKMIKGLPESQKLGFVEQLKEETGIHDGVDGEEFKMLTWDKIRSMGENGLISYGSHTKTHCILSSATSEDAFIELKESKEVIEKQIAKKVTLFSYPNGKKNDYTERDIDMLKKVDYKYACTTEYGFNDLNTNPFELKRVGYNYPNYFLACKMLFHSKSRKYD